MSILSGFFKTIKYRMTDEGYKWQSEKTSSQTVVMGDGTDDTDTLEKRLGAIKGLTTSTSVTTPGYVADATVTTEQGKAIATLNESLATLNTNLTTHKTSSDHDDRYYTETEVDSKLAQKSKVTIQAQTLTGNGSNWVLVNTSKNKLIGAQTVRDDTSFYVAGINKQSTTGLYTLIFNKNIEKGLILPVWLILID